MHHYASSFRALCLRDPSFIVSFYAAVRYRRLLGGHALVPLPRGALSPPDSTPIFSGPTFGCHYESPGVPGALAICLQVGLLLAILGGWRPLGLSLTHTCSGGRFSLSCCAKITKAFCVVFMGVVGQTSRFGRDCPVMQQPR